MPNITIVHKYRDKEPKKSTIRVYVGRPSPLGNPYVLQQEREREQIIKKYGEWFKQQIKEQDPKFLKALQECKEVLSRGYHLELECYCAPRKCHASVIKEYLES